jgi:hypothetical protein
MRLALVLTVLLSAAVGLVSSDGAEPVMPPAQPKTFPMPALAPPPVVAPMPYAAPQPGHVAHPVPPSHYQPPAYAPAPYIPQHGDVTRLRQEYVAMAKKRAERMDGAELQKGIAEMRCQWLIGELTALGSEYDDVRAGVAVMVLKAKDKDELKKLFRSIVEELGDDEPKGE